MTTSEETGEKILKSRENVICKISLVIIEGTLYLTGNRLLFSTSEGTDEGDENFSTEGSVPDLLSIASSPGAISIPLESIDSADGKKGTFRPSLLVVWHNPPDNPETTKTEFVQKSKSKGNEEIFDESGDIDDWVPVIQELAAKRIAVIQSRSTSPDSIEPGGLESQILQILEKSESWTGFFRIEGDLEEREGKSLDPDLIDDALKKLVSKQLIEQDKMGMSFRKLKTTPED